MKKERSGGRGRRFQTLAMGRLPFGRADLYGIEVLKSFTPNVACETEIKSPFCVQHIFERQTSVGERVRKHGRGLQLKMTLFGCVSLLFIRSLIPSLFLFPFFSISHVQQFTCVLVYVTFVGCSPSYCRWVSSLPVTFFLFALMLSIVQVSSQGRAREPPRSPTQSRNCLKDSFCRVATAATTWRSFCCHRTSDRRWVFRCFDVPRCG